MQDIAGTLGPSQTAGAGKPAAKGKAAKGQTKAPAAQDDKPKKPRAKSAYMVRPC